MTKRINWRGIAESMWGYGGTKAYKTTRKGCYYYSCAGHGGYIIDGRVLSDEEKERLEKHIPADTINMFMSNGKMVSYHHPYKKTKTYYYATCTQENFPFYVLEEDCDWCLASIILGVYLKCEVKEDVDQFAKKEFWQWMDRNNPVVANRDTIKQERKNGSPDLIISASRDEDDNSVTIVRTADDKVHKVRDYKNGRDEFNVPRLHLCTVI